MFLVSFNGYFILSDTKMKIVTSAILIIKRNHSVDAIKSIKHHRTSRNNRERTPTSLTALKILFTNFNSRDGATK